MKDIVNKFSEEISNIKDYIDFLENHVTNILYPKVINIEDEKINLDEINIKNNNQIYKITKDLEQMKLEQLPSWFENIDQRSEEGEFISYIMQELEVVYGTNKYDTKKLVESIREELESTCIVVGDLEDGEFYLNLYENRAKIYEYVELTKKLYNNILYYDKQKELNMFNNNKKALKLIDTKNNTNIYRQSFNQLIFLFDSTMFDIIRYKFNENFFVWINYFKKDEGIKFKEIGLNDDYDSFKLMIIEKLLKGCYLKDLIEISHKNYSYIFYINKVDTYIDFIEMVNRRNCHIHNNGIVDNSYLGIDKTNKEPKYNKYNFQLEEYIEIDKKYFEKTLNNCIELLMNIKDIDIRR